MTPWRSSAGYGRFGAPDDPARAGAADDRGWREGGARDLKRVQPYDPGRPAEIKVEFKSPDRMNEYANRKGVEVLDPRTIVARGGGLVDRLAGVLLLAYAAAARAGRHPVQT